MIPVSNWAVSNIIGLRLSLSQKLLKDDELMIFTHIFEPLLILSETCLNGKTSALQSGHKFDPI